MREVLFLILIMVFLVALNLPWLALFVGVAGALMLATATRLGEPRHFEPVEVPPAGGYPGYDFWKGILEASGETFGKMLKLGVKIDKALDKWGDFWKKEVWQDEGSPTEFLPPGIVSIDKNVAGALTHLNFLQQEANTLQSQLSTLAKALESEQDPQRREQILRKMEEIQRKLEAVYQEMENIRTKLVKSQP